MLVAGELKSDFPVIRRKPGIVCIDRAPGQFFGSILTAIECLGSRCVQQNGAVPWCLGYGVIDFQVRAGLIAELSQGKPAGGAGGRP